jgi:hypothetical protein
MKRHAWAAVLFTLILLVAGLILFQLISGGEKGVPASLPLAVAFLLLVRGYNRLQAGGSPVAAKPAPARAAAAAASTPVVSPTHPLIVPPKPAAAVDPDAPPRRTSTIDTVRALLGEVPRTFDRQLAAYLQVEPPAWVDLADGEFGPSFVRQAEIRSRGVVAWAAIVQANNSLCKLGSRDAPASVIYSEDPWFDTRPDALVQVAHDLFALKHTDQEDPEAATFARVLTNERIRAMRLRVPARFAGRRAVFHSSIMLARKHLPEGYLNGSIMPVWVDPADDGTLLLVPAAYWSGRLLSWWGGPADPPVTTPNRG